MGFGASTPKTPQQAGQIDEATSLPLNDDGTVTIYHATRTKEAADEIRRTGILKSGGEPDVYVSTAQSGTGYGDHVVALRVDPKKLVLDDEFPDGRRDFRINTGKSRQTTVRPETTPQQAVRFETDKVIAPTDDVQEVISSNFYSGKVVGNRDVPIEQLKGGVMLDDPKEAARVAKLAEKMSGPDGFFSRIIVDENGNVLEGQHRLEAMRQLGAETVPAVVVRDNFDGLDVMSVRDALASKTKIHKDQALSVLEQAQEMLAELGSAAAVKREYDFPKGFESSFDEALKLLETGAKPPIKGMGFGAGTPKTPEQAANLGSDDYAESVLSGDVNPTSDELYEALRVARKNDSEMATELKELAVVAFRLEGGAVTEVITDAFKKLPLANEIAQRREMGYAKLLFGDERVAIASIRRAIGEAKLLGKNPEQVFNEALAAYTQRFSDPEDAAFMRKSITDLMNMGGMAPTGATPPIDD
jgi:hypothetical protein